MLGCYEVEYSGREGRLVLFRHDPNAPALGAGYLELADLSTRLDHGRFPAGSTSIASDGATLIRSSQAARRRLVSNAIDI